MGPWHGECALVLLPDGTAVMHSSAGVTAAQVLHQHPGFTLRALLDPRYQGTTCSLPPTAALLPTGVYQLHPDSDSAPHPGMADACPKDPSPSWNEGRTLQKQGSQRWSPRVFRPKSRKPGFATAESKQQQQCPVAHSLPVIQVPSNPSIELEGLFLGFEAAPPLLQTYVHRSGEGSRVITCGMPSSTTSSTSSSTSGSHRPLCSDIAAAAHPRSGYSRYSPGSPHTPDSATPQRERQMFLPGVIYDSRSPAQDHPGSPVFTRASTVPSRRSSVKASGVQCSPRGYYL